MGCEHLRVEWGIIFQPTTANAAVERPGTNARLREASESASLPHASAGWLINCIPAKALRRWGQEHSLEIDSNFFLLSFFNWTK